MADEWTLDPRSELAVDIRSNVPHAARIWNYWMGGKDYYPADQVAGDAVAEVYPEIVTMATQSRSFLIRAVRFLAGEASVRRGFISSLTSAPACQR